MAVGDGKEGRPMFVVFTFRKFGRKRFIRPISARYMHKKEIRKYEKAFKKNEDR